MRTISLFVSSPADAMVERARVDRVVSRLNSAFVSVARIDTIRWETEFYQARDTFQAQIPPAADCDIVIAIFKARLGTPLPASFERMADGQTYPSGTAFEVLTAIEAAKIKALPDVYVFRNHEAPIARIDDPQRGEIEGEWERLRGFFERWFVNRTEGFKAAFNSFDSADAFEEQLEQLLRSWLANKVLVGQAAIWPVATLGSPFKGLEAFGAKHAPVFFGRDRDIARAVDTWSESARRGVAFLLVNGLSGAGKSSLVKAGLVPRITAPGVVPSVDVWRVAAFRPGRHPIAALAAHLFDGQGDIPADDAGRASALPELAQGDHETPAELEALLKTGGTTAIRPILKTLDRVANTARHEQGYQRHVVAALLVIVDQLDEIFAPSVSEGERERFEELLDIMARSGRIWVVATLRADLTASFLRSAPLRTLKETGGEIVLSPPGLAELAEIVRAPARAANLIFERNDRGVALDEQLLSDADKPDMLPLVQLALDKIFAGRIKQGEDLVMPWSAYRSDGAAGPGGLDALLDTEATSAMATLGPAERDCLPRLLRQLVEIGRDGNPTIRSVPLSIAAPDETTSRLVTALVDRRILLSDQDGIRIAHQRVIESWPLARELVAQNVEFYRVRDEIGQSWRTWHASGEQDRKSRLLAAGKPLADGENLVRRFSEELPPEISAYVAASGTHVRRGQRRVQMAAIVFAMLAVTAGVVGYVALEARQQARSEAQAARAAEAIAEQQRDNAQRNFVLARSTLDDIIFQFAQGFKNTEGVRSDVIRRVLTRTRAALDRLSLAAPNDVELQRMRAALLNEFGQILIRANDGPGALAAFEESLALARAILLNDPGGKDVQSIVAVSLERVGDARLRAGQSAAALATFEEALDIRRKLAAAEPHKAALGRGVYTVLGKVGDAKLVSGDLTGAVAYDEALALMRGLLASEPGNVLYQADTAGGLSKVGDAARREGHLGKTLAAYEEASNLQRSLVKTDPANTAWRRDLAIMLQILGDIRLDLRGPDAAQPAYWEALTLLMGLVASDPGNTGWRRDQSATLMRLGDLYVRRGDIPVALTTFEESLKIRRSLWVQDPSALQWRRDTNVSLNRIGSAKLRLGDHAGAAAAFTEALTISRTLAAAEPTNSERQRDVAIGLDALANAVGETETSKRLLALREEALAARRAMSVQEPNNLVYLRDVSISLDAIADIKLRAGDVAGAVGGHYEAMAIRRKLLTQNSHSTVAQRDLMLSVNKLGDIKSRQGERAAALAFYELGLQAARHMTTREPANIDFQRDKYLALTRVGDARFAQSDISGALPFYREALDLARQLKPREPNPVRGTLDVSLALWKVASAENDTALKLASLTEARNLLQDLDSKAPLEPGPAGWLTEIERDLARLEAP